MNKIPIYYQSVMQDKYCSAGYSLCINLLLIQYFSTQYFRNVHKRGVLCHLSIHPTLWQRQVLRTRGYRLDCHQCFKKGSANDTMLQLQTLIGFPSSYTSIGIQSIHNILALNFL